MNIAEETKHIIALEALAEEAKRVAAGKRQAIEAAARDELTGKGVAPSWAVPQVGKVWLSLTKQAAVVSDMAALSKWVADRHPEQMQLVAQIRPAFLGQLLAGLTIDDDMAIDANGEIVPGVSVRKGGQPDKLTVKADPDVKRTVGDTLAAMLATAHPAIVGAPVQPEPVAAADPWTAAGDPFVAFPAVTE